MKLKHLRELFESPPVNCRSMPFWAWNDSLNEEELVVQIDEMKNAGMGGFFIHSRDGLETEYLGEKWLECIKIAVQAAKKAGVNAWLYDEDKWPSGAAGGLVPFKGGDEFRVKRLIIEIVNEGYERDENTIALFKALINNKNLLKFEKTDIQCSNHIEQGEVLLVFKRAVSGPGEWYNDDAPADNLNPDCVKAFIETTHEVYKGVVGSEFGKTIPGLFTDEPNVTDGEFGHAAGDGWVPWTDGFDEFFQLKRGYDILEYLPYLFFEGEKSSKTRHDFWRTVSDRFGEAFPKQVGQWCEDNNLMFTGHFLDENRMGNYIMGCGSIMPHYRYQHIPGIDILHKNTDEVLTVRQCTSVANQYGRKRVLSETYGCTGWDFAFEEQKWLGDWQFVMGVNLICKHQALYSLKGCRKRDFPPSFNYNTSWWKYNNVIEDYFARLATVLTQGEVIRDILVIHPVSTAWSMAGCEKNGWGKPVENNIAEVNAYGEEFSSFLRNLHAFHYDFDLGDETIMEEKAIVKEGRIKVNKASYQLVVIPPVITLFENTVRLLEEFMENGGKIIGVEPLAGMIEGVESERIKSLFEHDNFIAVSCETVMFRKLEELMPRKVSISGPCMVENTDFLYMLRKLDDCWILFIVNSSRGSGQKVNIRLNCVGCVEEWNILKGEFQNVEATPQENGIGFTSEFSPLESRLFIIDRSRELQVANLQQKKSGSLKGNLDEKVYTALGPVAKFTRTMPNALVLDKCKYVINGGLLSEEMDVWKAQKEIRELLGMRQIFSNDIPQRYTWINRKHPMDGTLVEFIFTFYVKDIPRKETYLVLEGSHHFEITLNTTKIPNTSSGWFMDRSFDKIKLSGIRKGENRITLSCSYQNRMEVEDCYIIGDFGVDAKRNMVKEPDLLHFGDWCLQGYFHYPGSIIYHFDFTINRNFGEKVIMEIGEHSAVIVETRINEKHASFTPWSGTNRVDITHMVNEGINSIDIELAGSPRNLFGPFHRVSGLYSWSRWTAFRAESREYTPEYVVKPYGLFGQINIYTTINPEDRWH